jgi:metal-sulfur cluster biosynthetic enzyme
VSMGLAEREAEVRHALDRVTDPELDEAVTDLRFIEYLTVDPDGDVAIGFRLPTYWCAANFAFLMADDMRREVGSLPWVRHVRVTLGEHMYGDKINHGLANGLSFQATFGSDASASLDELRRTFLIKAFQRRQETLLRQLLSAGQGPEEIVSMTVTELEAANDDVTRRYLARRQVCAAPNETLAFIDVHGAALIANDLSAYLQTLGRVTINAEFNGALCRGLLAQRFNETGEPTLYDFARMPTKAA